MVQEAVRRYHSGQSQVNREWCDLGFFCLLFVVSFLIPNSLTIESSAIILFSLGRYRVFCIGYTYRNAEDKKGCTRPCHYQKQGPDRSIKETGTAREVGGGVER